MKRLQDKNAIVFGGGPNIGGTIAHFLAREGARVAICDDDIKRSEEAAAFLKSRGYDALAMSANYTGETEVARVVDEAVQHYGAPDILVNTVGQINWGSVLDISVEAWLECLTSFPTAGLLTTRHAARAMIAAGKPGSIIHVLSTGAHFGKAGGSAYTSAKAALLGLARSAAMDLAHAGIRVNTITPCAMEHNLWTHKREEILDPNYVHPRDRAYYTRDDFLKNIPMARFPRASDLAWASVFLASDEAGLITGVDLPIDGGLRFKYPTWRPGDFTGVNIEDYAKKIHISRYGEDQEKFIP